MFLWLVQKKTRMKDKTMQLWWTCPHYFLSHIHCCPDVHMFLSVSTLFPIRIDTLCYPDMCRLRAWKSRLNCAIALRIYCRLLRIAHHLFPLKIKNFAVVWPTWFFKCSIFLNSSLNLSCRQQPNNLLASQRNSPNKAYWSTVSF